MTDQTDFEELEQIPWAALAAKPADPRARYGAIGATILLVVAAIAWLVVRTEPSTAMPAAITTSSPPVTALPQGATDAPLPAPTTTAAVYSEADLMLIDISAEERMATMHAIWLVRDLLTVDGDAVVTARIDRLLPTAVRSDTPSYVEWAEAFAVASPEPGRYRVEVVYRLLTGDDGSFSREPAGALVVDLALDVDGSARLLAAPEPIPVPVIAGPVQ
jgi:hypothetical protein